MLIRAFGLVGFNASATAKVISRFGLLGFNASAAAGSYQGLVIQSPHSIIDIVSFFLDYQRWPN